MVDLTHTRDFAQKKTISVLSATLRADDFAGLAVKYPHTLFNMPENSLLLERIVTIIKPEEIQSGESPAFLFVDAASNSVSVDLSTLSVEISRSRYVVGAGGLPIKVLIKKALKSCEFIISIRYIEYTLKSGNLTNYSDN